ncbi:MAG: branched-chain amino acid ABC transporter permease [Gammaproteobacteria bacterium WSBS_2016_MAG_OTU1]
MEQIIVNGLYLGAQYALIALGLTLIFGLMNVLNFAHGQMYVLGGFMVYLVYSQWELPFFVAILVAALTLLVVGAAVEKFLFRPVIRKSVREESTMLLAAGLAFLFDAIILLLFGQKQRGVPKIMDGVQMLGDFIVVMPNDKIVIGICIVLMIVGFMLFMQYTRPGRAMRALAQDRTAAQLMGVNVEAYSMLGFAIGAMLAGVAGGLLSAITGVSSGIGAAVSIKAFLMVMIGGAGVVPGAIIGGFILGMMESFGLTYLREYGDITYLVIFASLMVFLSIRPQGLMGKPWG